MDKNPAKRGTRTSNDTIVYLKERSEKDSKIKQQELELKKAEQAAQAKQQTVLTQQLINQQQLRQKMFSDFQNQQQQQLQQLSQMQMTLFQQQQQ